jgi:hypothetical protein
VLIKKTLYYVWVLNMECNKINKIFYDLHKKFYFVDKETKDIRWWHKIELPNGELTPGLDQNEVRWQGMVDDMPSFKNKTVMDVGAWDGYFSFKAESLGASRILAVDHFCWSGPGYDICCPAMPWRVAARSGWAAVALS